MKAVIKPLVRTTFRTFSTQKSSNLNDILLDIVTTQRQKLRELRQLHGKQSLGCATLGNLLEGGKDIPVIYSEFSKNDQIRQDLTKFYNSLPSKYAFEATFWYFFTHGHTPTHLQLEHFTEELQKRRQRILKSSFHEENMSHSLQLLPKQSKGRVYLSMATMLLQPTSYFYQHRRETKKPDQYKVILEDILNVFAIFPDLLTLVNKQSLSSSSTLVLGQGHCVLDALMHAFPWDQSAEEISDMKSKMLKALMNGVEDSLDGGMPLLHIPRLVSCTLSDPYLATAAMLNAYSTSTIGSEYDANDAAAMLKSSQSALISASEGTMIMSKVTAALVNIFWDRCLTHPLENPKSLDFTSVMALPEEFEKK